MQDIIERIVAFSNEDMVRRLESMKAAILSAPKVKKGKKMVEKVLSDKSKEAIERIDRSIDFYVNEEPYVYESEEYQDDVEEESEEEFFAEDNSIQWRPYQIDIIERGSHIIRQHGFLYLAMQVRTGKTLTSLGICEELIPKQVLFITKKKAMRSVLLDYEKMGPSFTMTVVNYESLHKYSTLMYDVVICDEAHSMGAFAKPSGRALQVRALIQQCNPKVILMSGTPTPESFSQMYHQVFGIRNNPFAQYKNFYRFADDYVDVKTKMINSQKMNDYSHGKQAIIDAMKPYTIEYTQSAAGFTSEIVEHILYVEPTEYITSIANQLRKNLVVELDEGVILAETGSKYMSKLHQIYSGTVKFESGESMVLDTFKAEFIKRQFDGCKIGIFYKFKEEFSALKHVFGDKITASYDEFVSSDDMNIAWQIVSGREGTSLKEAEYIVYFNIDFSATSYWQSRDRMTTIDRPSNEVYWIFTVGSIDEKIYQMVKKKKNYTLKHFERDIKKL